MTRSKDILAAEALGVEYVGFVFVPSSPRSISLPKALELRSSVRSARIVAVFETTANVERCVEELRPDFIQLYDDRCLVSHLSSMTIRAFRGLPSVDRVSEALDKYPYVLIDKRPGRSETDFTCIAVLPAAVRKRLFLSGGLHTANVKKFTKGIQPYALDCARGIESSPGVKDIKRMASFLSSLSS
jgi:phosphoribosylanthranilate isomerase